MMVWNEIAAISEDCKSIVLNIPPNSVLDAGELEQAIKIFGSQRAVMEPPVVFDPLPPREALGIDARIARVVAVPSDTEPRVGIAVCTNRYGWLLLSMATEEVNQLIEEISKAAMDAPVAGITDA